MAFFSFLCLFLCAEQMPSHAQTTCLADYGTVTAPANNIVCYGGINAPVSISGNNTSTHSTAYMLANSQGDIVRLPQASPVFDFAGLSGGDYYLHTINYAETSADLLQDALLVDPSMNYLAALVNANALCADLDAQGILYQMTNPIEVQYSIVCNEITSEFTAHFLVEGGLPELIPSLFYTYIGATNSNSQDIGTAFTIGPFTDGSGFTLTATDDCNSNATVVVPPVACTKCHNKAGTMPTDLITISNNEPLSIAGATGYELAINDSTNGGLLYVLRTFDDTMTVGNVVAIDYNGNDGTADFSLDGVAEGLYYVSAVAAVLDGDGNPNFQDECTKVSNGTPINVLQFIGTNPTSHLSAQGNLSVLPNPAQDYAELRFELPNAAQVVLLVSDLCGRTVQTLTWQALQGNNTRSIDMSKLNSGMYLLRLQSSFGTQNVKILVD